jgi:hypothetical protein
VDFVDGDSPTRGVRSVLLPASTEEVTRLARVVKTIDAPSIASPLRETKVRIPPGIEGELSVRNDNSTRTILIANLQRKMSHVVDGLSQEVETVGLVALATAIHERQDAERHLATGDVEGAIRSYGLSVHGLSQWSVDFGTRYGILTEPFLCEAADLATYPIWLTDRAAKRAMESMKNHPQDPNQVAIQALRESWHELSSGIEFSENGVVTTVTFPESGDRRLDVRASNLPSTIPPTALEQLLGS